MVLNWRREVEGWLGRRCVGIFGRMGWIWLRQVSFGGRRVSCRDGRVVDGDAGGAGQPSTHDVDQHSYQDGALETENMSPRRTKWTRTELEISRQGKELPSYIGWRRSNPSLHGSISHHYQNATLIDKHAENRFTHQLKSSACSSCFPTHPSQHA